MHFSPSFFHWAKPMPSRTRSLGFSNSQMRPSPRHENTYMIISLHAPHHSMEEWFIIQSFYHGLIRLAQEHIDAAAGGSFFTLSIEEAHKLVEKMVSNQSWDEERTQTRTRKVHQLEEVDMLTTKIDLLMKKLENLDLNHLKMVNA
jgi:glycosidase